MAAWQPGLHDPVLDNQAPFTSMADLNVAVATSGTVTPARVSALALSGWSWCVLCAAPENYSSKLLLNYFSAHLAISQLVPLFSPFSVLPLLVSFRRDLIPFSEYASGWRSVKTRFSFCNTNIFSTKWYFLAQSPVSLTFFSSSLASI